LLRGDVSVIFFDFDGTLTATPGTLAMRHLHKSTELRERASLLAPRLAALRDAGMLLGIISKSTECTIRNSLNAAGLEEFFKGPVIGKAVGLEGKVGFIEELLSTGALPLLRGQTASLHQVLLVDDDVRELDRARAKGVQTWPAPADGGLQEEDFNEIFARLCVRGHHAKFEALLECCSPKCTRMGLPEERAASAAFGTICNPGA